MRALLALNLRTDEELAGERAIIAWGLGCVHQGRGKKKILLADLAECPGDFATSDGTFNLSA
jgi:hypothetical protein